MARLLTSLALLSLGACGFHLRTTSADVSGTVFVQIQSGTEDFAREVERALDISSRRSRDAAGADWILHLQQVRELRRTLSVTGNVRALEYQITTEVRFRVLDDASEERVPSSRVSAERIYVLERDNLLGAAQEEAVLRREMQSELVRRVLRVIEAAAQSSSAVQGSSA